MSSFQVVENINGYFINFASETKFKSKRCKSFAILQKSHTICECTYFSACERQSCKENEWNVLIVSSLAVAFPATAPMRSLISEAAAVVKVIARMFDGLIL